MTLNEFAANWWAERFLLEDKRDLLKQALLKVLPESDWYTYVDYDPQDRLLIAIREFMECRGYMYSAQGLFPFTKTGLLRDGNSIRCKEGYGASWNIIYSV